VTADIGAYSIYPWTAAIEPVQTISFLPGPYRVPTYRGRTRGVATCKTPLGPYRGVGRPPAVFVIEGLMDRAARRLGLDPTDIRLLHGDTALSPYGTGTYASRSLVLAGGAAIMAGRAVREKMLTIAGHLLEADPADLVPAAGRLAVRGMPDRSVTVREIARAA